MQRKEITLCLARRCIGIAAAFFALTTQSQIFLFIVPGPGSWPVPTFDGREEIINEVFKINIWKLIFKKFEKPRLVLTPDVKISCLATQ